MPHSSNWQGVAGNPNRYKVGEMHKAVGCGVVALLVCGVALPAWADDEADVAAAMNAWRDSLAKGTSEDPGEILDLYAEDAVLWGTISSKRRDDPTAIRDYFVNAYKALPGLTVTFEDPNIRVYGGDTAVNTGYYTFSYEKDGATQSLPARYSFTLVKRDGDWEIVDHHSSAMPAPPR
jgi:uncharacterized protein (TIGR02246 family)